MDTILQRGAVEHIKEQTISTFSMRVGAGDRGDLHSSSIDLRRASFEATRKGILLEKPGFDCTLFRAGGSHLSLWPVTTENEQSLCPVVIGS